jgi:hypothetical protein
MITPVAFENIGYQTYIIFAVINAFIFPVVYFFYPETAYRSLEEVDTIFQNSTSIFNVVSVARKQPHRYGKNGELLINYQDTEEHLRRASHVSEKHGKAFASSGQLESGKGAHIENNQDNISTSS